MRTWRFLLLTVALVVFATPATLRVRPASSTALPLGRGPLSAERAAVPPQVGPAAQQLSNQGADEDEQEAVNEEQESEDEAEAGQTGEPSPGHEDPPGDVNHECTGDCVE